MISEVDLEGIREFTLTDLHAAAFKSMFRWTLMLLSRSSSPAAATEPMDPFID